MTDYRWRMWKNDQIYEETKPYADEKVRCTADINGYYILV